MDTTAEEILTAIARSSDLTLRGIRYVQPVIVELQQQPLPNGYLDYLRLKFRKVASAGSCSDFYVFT